MLTGDLVRARRKGENLTPAYLRGPGRERLLPYAESLIAALQGLVGERRDAIDEALDELHHGARDRVTVLGLRKLCEDRSTYGMEPGPPPEDVRRAVFFAASRAHQALGVRDRFDRGAVLAQVGAELGVSPEALDARLFADLRGEERLLAFDAPTPSELLERYDVALAQATLFRATKVVLRVEGESPARYRALFRSARFHGLLHLVEGSAERGYTITLDGPMSLFEASSRYGVRLAMFLPAVLACRAFHLRAELAWGKAREPAIFTITPADELVPHAAPEAPLAPELADLCEAFARLRSPWKPAPNDRVLALPGEAVVVPDLVFRHEASGREVYFEHFGPWCRDAVFRRVEALKRGLGAPLLLAGPKELRASEELLSPSDGGCLYIYRATLSARAVHERLDALAGALASAAPAPPPRPAKKPKRPPQRTA